MAEFVQRMDELKDKLLSERKMKYRARAERDAALRRVDRLLREVGDLKKQLIEARKPFNKEHDQLVEAQLENIKLKRIIFELEEKHGLSKRDH